MEEIDPRHLLVKIAQILERLGIPYIITGGMAVFVWGRPRYTADIDTVIELQTEKTETLAKELMKLGETGYVSIDAIAQAIRTGGEFNFIDGNTGMKVDFWISKNDEFSKSQFERRVPQNILGTAVYFISPEDLILAKLRWNQLTPSSRQLEDVASIFTISRDRLNQEYLSKWAKTLGLFELLSKIEKLSKAKHGRGT